MTAAPCRSGSGSSGAEAAGATGLRDCAMQDAGFPGSGKGFAGYAVAVTVQPMWVAGFAPLVEPLRLGLGPEIRAVAVVRSPRVRSLTPFAIVRRYIPSL